jgi:putative NADH-flavin reductase
MKVTVFGATGQIGHLLVEQLLACGHSVTAFVRNPTKLTVDDARLVTGELSDQTRILDAVSGADAVISALGPSLKRSTKGTPVTDGTRHIVAAMQSAHVDRYVGLASPAGRSRMSSRRASPSSRGLRPPR